MPEPTPASLEWKNIDALWKGIEQAKASKDPSLWQQVCANVKAALEDWKAVVNKWPDLVKKYHIIQAHAKRIADPVKKQEALDAIQNIREKMPPHIRKAADAGQKLVPIKLESIGSLMSSLEGIRQGDVNAFAGPIKVELTHWYELQKLEQHKLNMLRTNIVDRLSGIQDPERRKAITDRITQIATDKREWHMAIDNPQTTPEQKKRYEGYLKNMDKEIITNKRRLEGVKGAETKAKLSVLLRETEAKMRNESQLQQELNAKADAAKYDALMWLVTNIAHPVKVLHTKRSELDRPMAAPYAPPKPEENPDMLPDDQIDVELERPPAQASECKILLSLITEGEYDLAKEFWMRQYSLSEGNLVRLENGVCGRIRLVESNSVVIDLFKNDVITESAVRAPFYKLQPYL